LDYDSLEGVNKAGRARELVAHMERRRRLDDLVRVGRMQRPDIAWGAPEAVWS
jgi:hypothetical protein